MIELQTQAPRALRVPLVGVRRDFEAAVSLPEPCPPPIESVRRVCRNLFGAPKPGEIDEMLNQEQARQHEYIRSRFNIDLKVQEALDRIQQQQHQQQQERAATTNKCNSTVNRVISMSSPTKSNNICEPEQRLKPYERQQSIKRCYVVRKASTRRQDTTPQNVPRCITFVAKTTTSKKSSHNATESSSDSSQQQQLHAANTSSKGQSSINCTVLASPRTAAAPEATTTTTTTTTKAASTCSPPQT